MLTALRQELQEMLATVPTLRRPALRRSEDANALFATDLPLLADAADFCRLAEKHGWRTWIHGGWLLLDKLPNPPDMPTKSPVRRANSAAACRCLRAIRMIRRMARCFGHC